MIEELNKIGIKKTVMLTGDKKTVGEDVGFDARLEEIKRNYGEDSASYKTSVDIVSYLIKLKEDKENDIH